jgi:hypothetical protein
MEINLPVKEELQIGHDGQKIGQRPVSEYAIAILLPSLWNKFVDVSSGRETGRCFSHPTWGSSRQE